MEREKGGRKGRREGSYSTHIIISIISKLSEQSNGRHQYDGFTIYHQASISIFLNKTSKIINYRMNYFYLVLIG